MMQTALWWSMVGLVCAAEAQPHFDLALTEEERQAVSPRPDLGRLIEDLRTGRRLLLHRTLALPTAGDFGPTVARFDEELAKLLSQHPFNCTFQWCQPWPGEGMTPEEWPAATRLANACVEKAHDRGVVVMWTFGADWAPLLKARLSPEEAVPAETELKVRADGTSTPDRPCFHSPTFRRRAEALLRKVFSAVDFDGMYFEEPGYWGWSYCYCEHCRRAFLDWLTKKYGGEAPASRAVGEPLETLQLPLPEQRMDRREVWAEWLHFCRASLGDILADMAGWADQAARQRWGKPTIHFATVGYFGTLHPYGGLRQTEFLRRPEISGMNNALYWQDFDYHPMVQVDSFRAYHWRARWCQGQAAGKPVWFYIIAKNEPGWVYEIEVYDGLLGGLDGFIPYAEQAEVAEGADRAFSFCRRYQVYLTGTQSVAPVAIFNSYDQNAFSLWDIERAFEWSCTHLEAPWWPFANARIPTDYLTDLDPSALARYKVLVLDEVRLMSVEQAEVIREWVRRGGVLLAQGDVASHDLLERPHAVPLLTDVQGLAEPPRFQAECPPTLEMIPSTPIRLFADSPIRSFADSPIRSFALSYGHRLLVGYHPRKPQVRREGYTLSPGADAHVLGQWEDGGPAVVASRFGQGWCISTGAFLQYLAPEAGSRLARAVVQWALGGKLPLRVSGLPPAGDVNVLRQEDRLMVHLLNLEAWQIKDPDRPLDADNLERIGKAKPVPKVEVEVALPDGFRPRRAFTISPDFRGERPVKLTVASGTARFSVGPLDLYQVVVIER